MWDIIQWNFIIFLKMIITFIFALFFGIERQKSHKPIGFGAFISVALGGCALGIIAITLVPENPLPLLSAIVTGIGFLGAGALIKNNDKLFGVNTAASIWVFAVMGLLIGVGAIFEGVLLYVSVWCVILMDRYLEKKGIGSYQRKITITTNKIIHEKDLKNELLLFTQKFKLISIEVDKKDNKMIFNYLVEGSKENINKLPNKLYEKEWFASCHVE